MAKYLMTNLDPHRKDRSISGMIVQADSVAIARELCASIRDDASWGLSAVAAFDLSLAVSPGAEGFKFRIRVGNADRSGLPQFDVSVTGEGNVNSGHTIDDNIGPDLVSALEDAGMVSPAYDAGSHVLTIADGTDDGLGDCSVEFLAYPAVDPVYDQAPGTAPVPFSTNPFQGTLHQRRTASDDLDVVLVTPTDCFPGMVARFPSDDFVSDDAS